MMRRLLRPGLVLGSFALVVVASCRDSTAVEASRISRPLTGTYDFTTKLDTFSYETGGPTDCPDFSGFYCEHFNPDSSGRLSGSFTIGDSVDTAYRQVAGTFAGIFRGSATQGSYSASILNGPLLMSAPQGSVDARLDGPTGDAIWLTGTFAGDSIAGRVLWASRVDRSPPTYWGHFVARRRP